MDSETEQEYGEGPILKQYVNLNSVRFAVWNSAKNPEKALEWLNGTNEIVASLVELGGDQIGAFRTRVYSRSRGPGAKRWVNGV